MGLQIVDRDIQRSLLVFSGSRVVSSILPLHRSPKPIIPFTLLLYVNHHAFYLFLIDYTH
ncbi:hypothetical protein M434DRAFT_399318 [Hypoxylon sp. CO27-5]|nr:hypothetical protein M434DRAFT_399318 [Hypoxylon sp. CO27-5]